MLVGILLQLPLRVVGITGVSRSGKGTLAAALAAHLGEHHGLAVISAYPPDSAVDSSQSPPWTLPLPACSPLLAR